MRRRSVWIVLALVAVWLLSLLSGFELIWARGHEAIRLRAGGLSYYRNRYEQAFTLKAFDTCNRTLRRAPRLVESLQGEAVTHLVLGRAVDVAQRPEYYPDGFAVNITQSQSRLDDNPYWRPSFHRTTLPLWVPPIAAMLPLLFAGSRLLMSRRRLRGRRRCPGCGYSIVGLPREGRCPECGAALHACG